MDHYIHTANGGKFYYGKDFAEFTIEDVAHHLSHVNRFCGATKFPYSVAQHSVLVEKIAEAWTPSRNVRLYALTHDCHEGFMSDIPTPFAKWFAQEFCQGLDLLEEAKQRLDNMILPRVGVVLPLDRRDQALIQTADKLAFVIEARRLFDHQPDWLDAYIDSHGLREFAHVDHHIRHMIPSEARVAFLNRWEELTNDNETLDTEEPKAVNG